MLNKKSEKKVVVQKILNAIVKFSNFFRVLAKETRSARFARSARNNPTAKFINDQEDVEHVVCVVQPLVGEQEDGLFANDAI